MVLGGKKVCLTEDDLEVIIKECAGLSGLQLPACEVKFTECIGEGLLIILMKFYI